MAGTMTEQAVTYQRNRAGAGRGDRRYDRRHAHADRRAARGQPADDRPPSGSAGQSGRDHRQAVGTGRRPGDGPLPALRQRHGFAHPDRPPRGRASRAGGPSSGAGRRPYFRDPPLLFLRHRWVWITVLVAFVVATAPPLAWPR